MKSMSFNNYLLEKTILPVSDLVMGQSIAKYLKFLQKSQWWTKSELKEYQNEKLRSLIKHAYENVPYYHNLFKENKLTPEDIKTTDDLYKLPILTKEIIRKNFKNGEIIAQNIPKNKLMLSSSSGSTGEPLQYYTTKNAYSFNIAANLRGWYWMGYRLGDRYIKLSQNPRKGIKKIQDKINNCHYLFAQQLTDDNFSIIVKEIKRIKPEFIRGYPDPMLFLANYIQKNEVSLPFIKAINTTGNILFPESRRTIEEAFNCKVFNSYSCEGGANVFECETHNCYHSSTEYAITEIITNEKEVEEGERGRVITTDLINFAVPFIRYDAQDYVTKSDKKCSCGRWLLAINKIDGRDSDILVTPSRKYLIDHNFSVYLKNTGLIKQFQVRQNEIDEFEIILKVNENFNNTASDRIHNYFQQYIGDDVNIMIHVVDDIPLTRSGKRRFLIRNKDIKLDI